MEWSEASAIAFLEANQIEFPLRWAPHPVLKAPSEDVQARCLRDFVRFRALIDFHEDYHRKIADEAADAFRHGHILPHWKDADELYDSYREVLINGGNRSGKTEYMARKVIETMLRIDNARVWCLQTTGEASRQFQQPVIYKYIPSEWKRLSSRGVAHVKYSQKNGFTDNVFIFPNGSQCNFMNYAQDIKVIEGGNVDLIWPDELVPLPWIETLRFRTITKKGKLVMTFTPVTGYTPVVRDYVAGMKVKEYRDAPLLSQAKRHVEGGPKGKMPYIAESRNGKAGLIWFHSIFNPYNPYDGIVDMVSGRSEAEIKIRAYGYAEKSAIGQFPSFTDMNVVKRDRIPTAGTRYMVTDPAGARNWFTIWAIVDEHERVFVYREWPSTDIGDWAEPSDKHDGKAGPAQRYAAGRGTEEYKQLWRDLENGEEFFERYIDPRAGGTQAVQKDGGTSLIDLLSDGDEPMWFTPAAGVQIESGVAIINDMLFYDQEKPMTILNEPRLYISEDCPNLIYALREWTNLDGDKGACKDPVDVLRYLTVMTPTHVPEGKLVGTAGGSY